MTNAVREPMRAALDRRARLQRMDHATLSVELVDPAAAEDVVLVDRITRLVNDVYATAERGLWRAGAARTTAAEMAALVAAGEVAVAAVDGQLAGVVRVQVLSEGTGELGMLVAASEHRGAGVGRALVDFAERCSRERGLRTVQLELLVPRASDHPAKVFLDDWYRRLGYEVVSIADARDALPSHAALLAVPCDFVIYEKEL
jgi:ribosomal protein S18 acetylase RimI-like enzyme